MDSKLEVRNGTIFMGALLGGMFASIYVITKILRNNGTKKDPIERF